MENHLMLMTKLSRETKNETSEHELHELIGMSFSLDAGLQSGPYGLHVAIINE
ncbi:hypothetical protein KIN20_033592 [Parelaphostrongylus tenuis]|uniref:Uncharacterized protein n=1 Tax=Parelaphostrongylus tenuis TaxID=148309 RepID=A0AAD5R8D2_PARTN|nr:hypothetical protein KIN20_033592 [Parelaphostrongylus tenuis]